MSNDLTFFTNEPNATLLERFKATLAHVQYFDVLVGYFRTSGFHLLVDALDQIEHIRILVGLNVDVRTYQILEAHRDSKNGQLALAFESTRQIRQSYTDNVVAELEHAPDTYDTERGVLAFMEMLATGKLEIRAHPDAAHPWDEEYLGPELPKDQWWQEVELPEPIEREKPKTTFVSPPARSTVKDLSPAFELKPPPTKQAQPKTKPAQDELAQPDQPAKLDPVEPVTDFTPPQGSRGERLKQVMELGDRVKANRQDTAAISQLVAALGDGDDSIHWLAGSALSLLGGSSVVSTLATFLEQVKAPETRQEAIKALQRIADNPREDGEVRRMAEQILVEK